MEFNDDNDIVCVCVRERPFLCVHIGWLCIFMNGTKSWDFPDIKEVYL